MSTGLCLSKLRPVSSVGHMWTQEQQRQTGFTKPQFGATTKGF